MIKFIHEFLRSGDRQDGTQLLASDRQLGSNSTFFQDKAIPFEFHIKMPLPRYYPMILERDEKGRIVNSKFPPIESLFIKHSEAE